MFSCKIITEWYSFGMAKRYDQYCPLAHALDLVGDRWALLVVRELMRGPKRYTDLVDGLPGIGTNILAARLRDLEQAGRRHPAYAAAAGRLEGLRAHRLRPRPAQAAMRELALWGARSLGPPTPESGLFDGWVANAMDNVLAPLAPAGRFEFRVGDEVASMVDGEVRRGPVDDPDVVVEADPPSLYDMFVNRRLDQVTVTGDRDLLEQLVAAAPPRLDESVTA